MRLVVDASVALKWFFAQRPNEDHIAEAEAVGVAIQEKGATLFAPPHWEMEIISVLAREAPQAVDQALLLLSELNPTIVDGQDVLRRAADLSSGLQHHVFDTFYHAVALEEAGSLVTADKTYFGKAQHLGAITWLADFTLPQSSA